MHGYYWLESVGAWCGIRRGPTCFNPHPALAQLNPINLDILLDPLSKGEFLQFIIS